MPATGDSGRVADTTQKAEESYLGFCEEPFFVENHAKLAAELAAHARAALAEPGSCFG
jgi:hypothetical protein